MITSSAAAGVRRAARAGVAALVLALAVSSPAAAQTLFQGRIDVSVQDAQDRAVPGATVEARDRGVSGDRIDPDRLAVEPGVRERHTGKRRRRAGDCRRGRTDGRRGCGAARRTASR